LSLNNNHSLTHSLTHSLYLKLLLCPFVTHPLFKSSHIVFNHVSMSYKARTFQVISECC